jgi:hypothetical protein
MSEGLLELPLFYVSFRFTEEHIHMMKSLSLIFAYISFGRRRMPCDGRRQHWVHKSRSRYEVHRVQKTLTAEAHDPVGSLNTFMCGH